MSTKAERNAQAYEQLTAVLTAVGKPMTVHELAAHPMLRPLEANTRSIGQWMKYLMKTGVATRRGQGSKRATYQLAGPKAAKGTATVRVSDSVIVTVSRDGLFRSVSAPAGVSVSLEIAA